MAKTRQLFSQKSSVVDVQLGSKYACALEYQSIIIFIIIIIYYFFLS